MKKTVILQKVRIDSNLKAAIDKAIEKYNSSDLGEINLPAFTRLALKKLANSINHAKSIRLGLE